MKDEDIDLAIEYLNRDLDPLEDEENRSERLYRTQARILRDYRLSEYERAYWKIPKFLKDKGIDLDFVIKNRITVEDVPQLVEDLKRELTEDQYFKLDPPPMSHSELVDNGYERS